MRFITFATHDERMLPLLKQSAINHNIKLEVFGRGKKWVNYGTKMHEVQSYISNIPDDEIIVFFDAFDTLILADEKEFKEKYQAFNDKITDVNKKDLIFSNGRNCIKYFKHCFLETNGGLFIGKSKKMKDLFSTINKKYNWKINGSGDVLLERFRNRFSIDCNYDLFYNYYFDGFIQQIGTNSRFKKQIKVDNNRIVVHDKKPLAIHFPKNSINKELLQKLGYEYDLQLGNRIVYVLNDFLRYYFAYFIKYFMLAFMFYQIIQSL
jgi:hypothetical protein